MDESQNETNKIKPWMDGIFQLWMKILPNI
jgi:hypothetical protein